MFPRGKRGLTAAAARASRIEGLASKDDVAGVYRNEETMAPDLLKMAERMDLAKAVLVGYDRVREVQAQVLELRAQGSPGDPQQESGPLLVTAGVLEDARE